MVSKPACAVKVSTSSSFVYGDRCRVAGHAFAGIDTLDEWPNVKVSSHFRLYIARYVMNKYLMGIELDRPLLGASSSTGGYAGTLTNQC